MALNDAGSGFDTQIEDEDGSIYPMPGEEVLGTLPIQPDRGSGSYAEDGREEILEETNMLDGESNVGSAAMYGPTEIGNFSEIGSAAMYGPTEIGGEENIEEYLLSGDNVGDDSWLLNSNAPKEDTSWLLSSDLGGTSEDIQMPFESFMLDETHMGVGSPDAVAKVIEKARDNRQPAPPLKAVDIDEDGRDTSWDDLLTDVVVGATDTGNPDPFPLTSQFLLRCGAGMEPRIVRVDTEKSYKQYRQDSSPELSQLRARLDEHMANPDAHLKTGLYEDTEDMDDIVMLGQEVDAAEKAKEVELWMPRHFDGQITAWREGDSVCSSMRIPGFDGEVRICTTVEPLQKCIAEMSRHAVEAGVAATSVVGVLPQMGCVLGAGTGLKEMAAAAKSIADRPEMKLPQPFMVRVEPKVNPALCALAMLAMAVANGVPGASDEWQGLQALCPPTIKQAMTEAETIAKTAGQ